MTNPDERKKRKYIVILILLLLVVVFSVGYALLTTKLKISGTSQIGKLTWDIHFDNIQVNSNSVVATHSPTIVGATSINYKVMLLTPGDFYEFTVDVKNDGSLAAKVSSAPKLLGVSSEQEKYVNYTVTYADGTLIRANDKLDDTKDATIKVRIEYDKNAISEDLPTSEQSLNLTFALTYIQA